VAGGAVLLGPWPLKNGATMPVSRPLNKEVLKKMFLKILTEFRPGGRYDHCGHAIDGILPLYIHEYFGIDRLNQEELGLARRAVYELERDGFIMQDPAQGDDQHKILTEKGKIAVEQDIDNMKLPSIDIDQLLSREDLRSRVRDDYLAGDYETAIFKAFRHLEESVRAKAKQPPSAVGVNLMTAAFKPSGGALKHPEALVDAEAEALHQLMRGAIGWFKNPSSHRTVGYDDAHQAAHVLASANLLLDLLDECS
jgi:uncharacterized protein (TIGR02391 family)